MGGQNFNFDPKFPQNKSLSASKFAFFNEKFMTRRRFSDSPKFRGVPQGTTPPIALKYEADPCPSWSPAPLYPERTAIVYKLHTTQRQGAHKANELN